jgi:hypothetical protein
LFKEKSQGHDLEHFKGDRLAIFTCSGNKKLLFWVAVNCYAKDKQSKFGTVAAAA